MKRKICTYIKESLKDKLFRRIVKNAGWLFTGNIAYGLLTACQSVILARMLGVQAFGVLVIIISIVSVVGGVFSCRITEFLTTYLPLYIERADRKKASNVLKISYIATISSAVIAILICIICGDVFSRLFIKANQGTGRIIALLSFSLIFNNCSAVAEASLRVMNSFGKAAILRNSERLTSVALLTIIFIVSDQIHMFSIAVVLVSAALVRFLLIHYFALGKLNSVHKKWYKIGLGVSKGYYREYISFLMHTNLSGTLSVITKGADHLWIGFFATPSAVGIYRVAFSFVSLLLIPINQFSNSAFPEISKLVAAESITTLKNNLKRMSFLAFSYLFPAFIGILLLGPWLITLLYGDGFVSANKPLLWILGGMGIAGIFFWTRPLLLSLGLANIAMYTTLVVTIFKIILMPVLVSRYAEVGAAITLLILCLVSTFLSVWIGRQKLCTCTQMAKASF